MANQTRLLELALTGLETERRRIDDEIAEIRRQLRIDGRPVRAVAQRASVTRRRVRLSAAGRKAIAEAAKRRWAAWRKTGAKAAKQT